eukprot:664254-Alexandrium_andersonii.AAC.1
MRRRGLRNDLEPQLLRQARAEIHRGRLVVRLEQDLAAAPQPVDAGHGLAHSVLAQAALAQGWMGQDRSRIAILQY